MTLKEKLTEWTLFFYLWLIIACLLSSVLLFLFAKHSPEADNRPSNHAPSTARDS